MLDHENVLKDWAIVYSTNFNSRRGNNDARLADDLYYELRQVGK